MRPAIFIVGIVLTFSSCGHFSALVNRPGTVAELLERASQSSAPDRPFHIKGVVTFADPLGDFFVIQDNTGGIRISLPRGKNLSKYGQLADVSGLSSAQGSSHSLVASDVSLLRNHALPPATQLSALRELEGQVYRRASLDGIVESVTLVHPGLKELLLRTGDGVLPVEAVLLTASDAEALIGAQVRATGVVLEHSSRQHTQYELWTPDIQNITVLTPRITVAPSGDPSRQQVIRTALQVHRLSWDAAALHHPVEFTGVVTFSDRGFDRLFVQDKTDAIYVQSMPGANPLLHPGDLVRVKGVTNPGDFAPIVSRAVVTVLRTAAMPAPDPDLEAAFMGQRDSRWVRLRGVAQDAIQNKTDVLVNLVWGEHRFKAHILAPLDQVKSLIDREVSIAGACGSIFNNRRQVLGIQLFVPGMKFISAKGVPVADPYNLPIRSASALLEFSRDDDFGHRAHIQGVVTFASRSGPTWIRDQSQGTMIATHDPLELRNGDFVDVVGFPAAGNFGPILKPAMIRKLRAGPPPAPVVTNADEASKGTTESQLIQLDGTLVDYFVHDGVRVLRLESGSDVFSAQISEFVTFPDLTAGSKLRLTGICSVNTDVVQGTLLARGFRLDLRSAGDVIVLQNGPWFTSGRLAGILTGTLALVIAALFWVALLRRNVRRQTQTLVSKSAQLESANTLANQALERARETESLEQSRRFLLELVANDEPLERIMIETARAAEKHSQNSLCSLKINLADGSQIAASPSAAPGSTVDFDRPPCQDRLRVPIVVGGYLTGAMVLQTTDGSDLSDPDQNLFPSWAQFASLAVERRGLYESLSFRARFDALTGLHNRASLYEKLGQELASAKKNQMMLAVLYIDLNGFKAVNNAYGHDAGDLVLCEVSERISKLVRRVDVVARLGGDEFVVVLTGVTDPADVEAVRSLLRSMLAKSIQINGASVQCGASVGLAICPRDGDQSDLLIKKADQEMYSEKSTNKRTARGEPMPERVPELLPAGV